MEDSYTILNIMSFYSNFITKPYRRVALTHKI